MSYDVIALGELLVDFIQAGLSEQDNIQFEANPGGAPCNVLAMLSKLGNTTSFIGKVGADQFGFMLKATLGKAGIDDSNLLMDQTMNTTLAFVHTLKDGDRDFSFYRNPGADMMLQADEVDVESIRKAKIFHFGSLSMTHETSRLATQKAVQIAKENGVLVSFDPNLRLPLWPDRESAKQQAMYGFTHCDILKISDNEVRFYTGHEDYDTGILHLQKTYGIPLILLTLGKYGSRVYYQDKRVEVPGFAVRTIETTGAGDTFCACILNYILESGLHQLTENDLESMLTFANAAAALVTTRKGALLSMPSEVEVIEFLTDY